MRVCPDASIHEFLFPSKENRRPHRENTIKTIQLLSAAVLAFASLGAQAQDDERAPTHARFGFQFGTVTDHHETEPVLQLSLGYDIDRTWTVEALGTVSLLFMRTGNLRDDQREFDTAFGVRALATLPLAERWNLVGGLGVVRFQEDVGHATMTTFASNTTETKTSPMVSAALMFKKSRHWSVGLEVSSYTAVHSLNAGLRTEVHF